MLYRPFADNLQELPPEDLIRLRDVHEGWYAEYKGELIANRELAKSLSSFANQYGGWLFLGVAEDSDENVAASFPGIPKSQVQNVLDSIRNSAKDLLNPPVFYNVREFEGPIDTIGLPVGRSQLALYPQRWANLSPNWRLVSADPCDRQVNLRLAHSARRRSPLET